jgi:hypothetical protein
MPFVELHSPVDGGGEGEVAAAESCSWSGSDVHSPSPSHSPEPWINQTKQPERLGFNCQLSS